jgi:hypothetical protein
MSITPEQATERFKADGAKWAKVIHDAGMEIH